MRVRASAMALTLTLAATLPAQSQDRGYERPFKAGVEARNARSPRWDEVERQMREAIKLNPKESTDKVGTVLSLPGTGTEYLPYFFLGEALFKKNDCAGAMDAWYRSESQGAIKNVQKYLQPMQSSLGTCIQKGLLPSPKYEEAILAAAKEIATTSGAAETAKAHGATAGDLFTPERQGQVDAAESFIKEAQGHLDSGRKTRAAASFTEVTLATRRASGILGGMEKELAAASAIRDDFRRSLVALEREIDAAAAVDRAIEGKRLFLNDPLLGSRQAGRDALGRARRASDAARSTNTSAAIGDGLTAATAATRQLQQVLNEVTELERKDAVAKVAGLVRSIRQRFTAIETRFKDFDAAAVRGTDPKLTAERQALENRERAAVREFSAAEKSGDTARIEAAGKMASQIGFQLDRLLQALGIKPVVPAELARAVQSFLDGDFRAALAALALEGAVVPDARFLPHAQIFRAAARYELYLRSTPADASQLAEARTLVADLVGLNPAFEPDTRAFSPRFREFFGRARQEIQTSAASVPLAPVQ